MKKKMNEKKKKGYRRGRSLAGLLPILFTLGHDTTNCIMTQVLGGVQGCAGARHDTATIWPGGTTTRLACVQGERQRVCA